MQRCECGKIETSRRAWRLQMDMCHGCYSNWKKAQAVAKTMRKELKATSS